VIELSDGGADCFRTRVREVFGFFTVFSSGGGGGLSAFQHAWATSTSAVFFAMGRYPYPSVSFCSSEWTM
jgi:hypothetical protein